MILIIILQIPFTAISRVEDNIISVFCGTQHYIYLMICGVCATKLYVYHILIDKSYSIDDYEITNVFGMLEHHLLINIFYTFIQT